MKKGLGLLLAVFLVMSFAAPVFAAKSGKKAGGQKYERMVAEVTSIDTATRMMVIKREENGEVRTIKVSARAAEKVQVGDRVRVKLKAGTNESAGVRVLGARPVAADVAVDAGTMPGEEPETK